MSKDLIDRLRDNRVTGIDLEVVACEAADAIECFELWKETTNDVIRSLEQQIEGLNGRFAKDQDRIACQAEQLAAQAAQIALLREAIASVLPWVVTQVVACNGLKCREGVCLSCTEESEANDNAQKACDAYGLAQQALAATPDDALEQVVERVKEQCADALIQASAATAEIKEQGK